MLLEKKGQMMEETRDRFYTGSIAESVLRSEVVRDLVGIDWPTRLGQFRLL
jgi:hypothetical protein